jgi:hypothetical protein
LQLRSACPYNKLIYSAYEAIWTQAKNMWLTASN